MNNLDTLKIKAQRLVNHFNSGNYTLVIRETTTLLKKIPNNAFLLNLLGSCYQKIGFFEVAEKNFLQVVQSYPNNLAAMNNLANTYKDMLRFSEAENYYKNILKIDPNYINGIVNYANLKFQLDDYEGAINLYNKALNTNNDLENIHYNIGLTYQSYGKFDKAEFHFKEMLRINPHATIADRLISRFTKYKIDSSHLKQMEQRYQLENLNDNSKINLYFALSKAYEDTKDFQKSYNFMKKANDLVNNKFNYNKKKDDILFNDLKLNFEKLENIKTSISDPEKKIIFILGLPRSGTSLAEQIISSHKLIYGAGEIDFLEKLIQKNFLKNDVLISNLFDQEKFSQLGQNIQKDYLRLFENFKTDKKIFTDKAPLNFKWIGFINYIFPNAKIIHCKRDIKDNFLSLYKNFFPDGLEWTYNEDNLISFCKNYIDIIKFWKNKYPSKIFDLNYEDLVTLPEKTIKDLLKFCDVEWDENCIKYHETKRSIKTLSVAEARRPIYKSSLSGSSNFEKFFSSTFRELESL